ncbi:hypothetical protein ACMFMG_011029 [Clarireedia jacksonii]
MQIGDLERMWNETIGNPESPWEALSYNCGDVDDRWLANYFLVSRRDNPLFARSHKLLLKLWAADGGKKDTEGMHSSPLLKGVPLMGGSVSFVENGKTVSPEETSKLLTDYIIRDRQ